MSYIAYFDSLRYTAKHFANPIKIRCTHRAHNAVEDAAVSSSANTFVVTVSRGFRSFSDPFISVFGGTISFVSLSPASSSDEGRLPEFKTPQQRTKGIDRFNGKRIFPPSTMNTAHFLISCFGAVSCGRGILLIHRNQLSQWFKTGFVSYFHNFLTTKAGA